MEHIDSVNNPIISVVENQGAEVVFAMQFFQILFIFFLADMVRYPALLTSLVGRDREQSRDGEPDIPKSTPELKSHEYNLASRTQWPNFWTKIHLINKLFYPEEYCIPVTAMWYCYNYY